MVLSSLLTTHTEPLHTESLVPGLGDPICNVKPAIGYGGVSQPGGMCPLH